MKFIIIYLTNKYPEINKMSQAISEYINRCVGCNADLGSCNPRQYCKKTYCPYEDKDESSEQDCENPMKKLKKEDPDVILKGDDIFHAFNNTLPSRLGRIKQIVITYENANDAEDLRNNLKNIKLKSIEQKWCNVSNNDDASDTLDAASDILDAASN